MAREGQEMAPIMHKLMHILARDQRGCAALGANEVDRKNREHTGKSEPGENLADRDWC
jgi:hypothetical protein